MKNLLSFLIMCFVGVAMAQNINQFDANGKRHGIWKKKFANSQVLRYEGQFSHGKEVGTFKFYKKRSAKPVLTAIKVFNLNNNIAEVQFLTSIQKVISKGKMNGKLYVGKWTYFHKNSPKVMITENYNNKGELDGERFVYYSNGKIAEHSFYKNGVLDGKSSWNSEKGTLLKELIYLKGKLQGLCKFYDSKGSLCAEGIFTNDKKDGIWNIYKDGELYETKNYIKESKNPGKY